MSTPNIAPYGALPTERQINHLKKHSKKAFYHFGVNTFSGVEWGDGTEMESIFNPSETDVRQWIKTAKEAGLTLAILTAKHHDGFCLWPSKYTKHSVKNSPYKNGNGDIVREFATPAVKKVLPWAYIFPRGTDIPNIGEAPNTVIFIIFS